MCARRTFVRHGQLFSIPFKTSASSKKAESTRRRGGRSTMCSESQSQFCDFPVESAGKAHKKLRPYVRELSASFPVGPKQQRSTPCAWLVIISPSFCSFRARNRMRRATFPSRTSSACPTPIPRPSRCRTECRLSPTASGRTSLSPTSASERPSGPLRQGWGSPTTASLRTSHGEPTRDAWVKEVHAHRKGQ